jgi:hypothetical protein
VIRYLLRVALMPRVLIVIIALEALNFLARGAPWRGDLMWTVDTAGTALFLIGPVIAAVVAWDIAGLGREGTLESLVLTARPHRAKAALLLASVIFAGVIHLLFTLTAIGLTAVIAGRLHLEPLLGLPPQFLAILLYASFGSALGVLLPRRVAPPVALVATAVLQFRLAIDGASFPVFKFGGATAPLIGLSYDALFIVVQVGVCAVVVLLLASVTWASMNGSSGSVSRRSTAAAIAGPVVLMVAWTVGPVNRFAYAEPPTPVCDRDGLEICVFPEHNRLRPEVVAVVAAAYRGLLSQGIPPELLPSRARELSVGERPGEPAEWTFSMPIEALGNQQLGRFQLVQDLMAPKHCPQIFVPNVPDERYFADVQFLSEFAADAGHIQRELDYTAPEGTPEHGHAPGTPDDHSHADPSYALPKPLAERAPQAIAIARAFHACRIGLLDLPGG